MTTFFCLIFLAGAPDYKCIRQASPPVCKQVTRDECFGAPKRKPRGRRVEQLS